MLLNGKTYKQWTREDLLTLLNNDDFREGHFLDYKRTFDFLGGSVYVILLSLGLLCGKESL